MLNKLFHARERSEMSDNQARVSIERIVEVKKALSEDSGGERLVSDWQAVNEHECARHGVADAISTEQDACLY
jgi:hypothetical protein